MCAVPVVSIICRNFGEMLYFLWSLCWSCMLVSLLVYAFSFVWFQDDIIFEKIFDGLDFLIVSLDALSSKSRTLKTKARKLLFARSIVLNPFFNYSSFRSNCSQTNSTDAIRSRSLQAVQQCHTSDIIVRRSTDRL